MNNGFNHLSIHDWRQFHEVDLDFSKRLTSSISTKASTPA